MFMVKRLTIAVVIIAGLSAVGFYFYPTLSRQSPGAPRQHTVTLTWNDAARATSYNIYRRAYGTDTLAKVGTSDKTHYFDSTVQAGLRYAYAVSSADAKGHESAKSQEIWATVPER
jgi:fibronectin type 3 domain-containing protein